MTERNRYLLARIKQLEEMAINGEDTMLNLERLTHEFLYPVLPYNGVKIPVTILTVGESNQPFSEFEEMRG